MGEIADSLINGEFDAISGEYLGKPVGYERTYKNGKIIGLHEDFEHDSNNKMNGIHKYLSSKRLKESKHTKCINAYLNEINAPKEVLDNTLRQKCIFIQKDFGSFVKWYSQLIRINKHLDF